MAEKPDIKRIRDAMAQHVDQPDLMTYVIGPDAVLALCDHALALKARNAMLESQITKKQELIEELEQTIAALEE